MKTIVLITLLNILAIQIFAQDNFSWPNNAKAGVCLTYDDGLDCHLDSARVNLNQYNLKGSFYCTGKSKSLLNRMDDWRQLVKDGHELGNHSLFHPCIKVREEGYVFDWVKPEYDLANYTVDQIIAELDVANTLLQAVDGKNKRTYAYTCGDHEAGGENFSDKISHLFTGARAAGPLPETMEEVNLYEVPSWPVNENTGPDMIAYVERAAEKGTLAVIMFHGIGANNLRVSRKAHDELLAYLAQHPDRFWVATFSDIVDYIRSTRGY
jgi:sialate O-acetylesterase